MRLGRSRGNRGLIGRATLTRIWLGRRGRRPLGGTIGSRRQISRVILAGIWPARRRRRRLSRRLRRSSGSRRRFSRVALTRIRPARRRRRPLGGRSGSYGRIGQAVLAWVWPVRWLLGRFRGGRGRSLGSRDEGRLSGGLRGRADCLVSRGRRLVGQ